MRISEPSTGRYLELRGSVFLPPGDYDFDAIALLAEEQGVLVERGLDVADIDGDVVPLHIHIGNRAS